MILAVEFILNCDLTFNYFFTMSKVDFLCAEDMKVLTNFIAEEDEEDELGEQQHIIVSQRREIMKEAEKWNNVIGQVAYSIGTQYCDSFRSSCYYRLAPESGQSWVMRTLDNDLYCYNMFRMGRPLFDKLHDLLVRVYGLRSTRNMTSKEALGMFLWTVGPPEPQFDKLKIVLIDQWRQ